MSDVNIKQVSGGEKNPPELTDAIELDTGTTSYWTLLSSIKDLFKTSYDALYGESKGRVEILTSSVPLTLGAGVTAMDGASTPAEQFPYFAMADGTYIEFLCRLIGYNGGGLTINFEVMRTSAAAAETYIFEAAIRRINTGTEDLGASHSYDYNAVTVTVPAGPPNAGIPMAGVITFTDGADMDSLANNEAFVLRFRENGGTAADVARVLATITGRET